MALYRIHAALHSEARTGDCWIPENFPGCNLIRVKNNANNRSVIVSYRQIEDNFRTKYNEPNTHRIPLRGNSIVLDDYYRKRLEVNTREDVDLEISPTWRFNICASLRYLRQHANDVVRITYWLGFIAVLMGILPTIKYGGEYLEQFWCWIIKK